MFQARNGPNLKSVNVNVSILNCGLFQAFDVRSNFSQEPPDLACVNLFEPISEPNNRRFD
jgi:hypothetical protein